MKKKAFWGAGLFVLVVAAVISCGYLISGREFSTVTPHAPHAGVSQFDATPQARNYNELKNQVIKLVENAQAEGNIRLYDYTSDVEADLPRACHEVMTATPIGAYAVDMMSVDHTRVLSYYDVKVTISYKRPPEEVLALKSANSAEEFEQVMREAMSARRSPFAVQCNYYTEKIINVGETMQKLRTTDPDAVYGIQDTTVQFFPESGLHKILLVEFLYYETAEESARKRGQASGMLSNYLKQTDSLAGRERVQALADLIRQGVTLVQSESFGDADMPYGPLVAKRATSAGFAVALKQACNQLGLYSVAVIGTYGGAEHWWNMVFVDNTWYHIDLSRGVLFADSAQMEGYAWDDLRDPTDLRART